MKLIFDAQKRLRVKHNFRGMTTFEQGWWHNHDLNKWQNPPDEDCNYGSHQPCTSVRAFRRKLKNAPRGIKFILCSKWKGHDVHGVGSKESIEYRVYN